MTLTTSCSPCRTSRRAAIRRSRSPSGRARRARRGCRCRAIAREPAHGRSSGCSTCTATPTTTARCSRSPAAPGALADALLAGAAGRSRAIDVIGAPAATRRAGQHPHVGALDVVPLVYLDAARARRGVRRGARRGRPHRRASSRCRCSSTASSPPTSPGARRTRAELRRGGVAGLGAAHERPSDGGRCARLRAAAAASDRRRDARRGAGAARRVQPAAAPPADARRRARDRGARSARAASEGLPGLRAIGVMLRGGVAQVSMNVERPLELPLAEVVDAVARQAPVAERRARRARPARRARGVSRGRSAAGLRSRDAT